MKVKRYKHKSVNYYLPENEAEVCFLIREARIQNKKIRVRGSYHSVNAAVNTDSDDDISIMLSLMNSVSIDHKNKTVTVQAGCHLGYDKWDPTKISTVENSLFFKLHQAGFALPDMGGISHQTVSGFLLTGASGSSVKSSFNENVISITFIPANSDDPVAVTVDPTGVNKDLFFAAGVSMGLLGIIVSVTFSIQPAYSISGKEIITTFEDCPVDMAGSGNNNKQSLRDFLTKNDYKRLLWYPQPKFNRVVLWFANQVQSTGLYQNKPYIAGRRYEVLDKWFGSIVLPQIVAYLIYSFIGLCPKWLSNLKWFNKFFYDSLLPIILRLFVPCDKIDKNKNVDCQLFEDHWHTGLPMDNEISDKWLPIKFAELWIPYDEDGNIDVVADVLKKLNEVFRQMFGTYSAPIPDADFCVEIMAAKESEYWMSPGYGKKKSMRVDFFSFGANKTNPETDYYPIFWEALSSFDFRCHWGKYLPDGQSSTGVAYLKRLYPKWDNFMSLRSACDPNNIFLTAYWKNHLGI